MAIFLVFLLLLIVVNSSAAAVVSWMVQNFAVPGEYNFTIPTGVDMILVEMWGAGGAGGRVASYEANNLGYAGGSGGFTVCNISTQGFDVMTVLVGGGGQDSFSQDGTCPSRIGGTTRRLWWWGEWSEL